MKKPSKTERIRKMLRADVAPAAIAKKVGVSKSYVYTVRSKMHKQERAAERASRIEAAEVDSVVRDRPTDPLDIQIGGDHYKELAIQPIQYIVANNMGFLDGCIVKRITRWRTKGGIEDLEKIKHEVDLLIAAEKGNL